MIEFHTRVTYPDPRTADYRCTIAVGTLQARLKMGWDDESSISTPVQRTNYRGSRGMIKFQVPAVPVAQPRQRHRIIESGGKSFSMNYTPSKSPVNSFKATVLMAAQSAYAGPPLEGALSVNIVFVMPRTKNMMWKTKPMPRVPYVTSKNDWDNLGKSLCDALNKRIWKDDGQLCRVQVERWIASGDEQPHVEVAIEELI